MTPKLLSATYVSGYTIHFEFEDGAGADVNFEGDLWGEVFDPLRDPKTFGSFRYDEELNTVVWSTGADFAPEFLYEKVVTEQRQAQGRTLEHQHK